MDYKKTLSYLRSLINYEKFSDYNYANAYNLDNIRKILLCLGNPQKMYPSVIISGTKGKGSCVSMLSSVLHAANVKTGKFISPHLDSVRERIEVSGERISRSEFSLSVSQIRKVASENNIRPVTFFEVLTAAAFLYFARKKIEIAILEVGLGGRLDATNIAQSLVAGIMPVSYDHTHLLGPTLKDIAREKCGIIHEHSSVISALQKPEVLSQIRHVVRKKKANLLIADKDAMPSNIAISLSGTSFDLKAGKDYYKRLYLPLVGRHQAMNASVAISLLGQVKNKFGLKVNKHHIRKGLATLKFPGRFQLLSRKPYIIFDGAQNYVSAKALRDAYMEIFKRKCSCIILGVSADKDVEAITRELYPITERMIFTRSDSPRALEPELLAKRANPLVSRDYICYDINDALKFAKAFAGRSGNILITGSLFLAKEISEALKRSRYLQLNTDITYDK